MNWTTTVRWKLVGFGLICVVGAVTKIEAQTYGQQLAVMKKIKAGLSTVGVLSNTLGDKALEDITRAAMGQGLKIFIARPKDAREIAALYKTLVVEKKVQMLWIPDGQDKLLLGVGFEFLKENALPDKIGLCVPDQGLVSQGALCSVGMENGKLTAYINQRISGVVGAEVPAEENSPINFVTR